MLGSIGEVGYLSCTFKSDQASPVQGSVVASVQLDAALFKLIFLNPNLRSSVRQVVGRTELEARRLPISLLVLTMAGHQHHQSLAHSHLDSMS